MVEPLPSTTLPSWSVAWIGQRLDEITADPLTTHCRAGVSPLPGAIEWIEHQITLRLRKVIGQRLDPPQCDPVPDRVALLPRMQGLASLDSIWWLELGLGLVGSVLGMLARSCPPRRDAREWCAANEMVDIRRTISGLS